MEISRHFVKKSLSALSCAAAVPTLNSVSTAATPPLLSKGPPQPFIAVRPF
ncbi:hypothetical protein LguiA_035876 [Lonicera macranthoides]